MFNVKVDELLDVMDVIYDELSDNPPGVLEYFINVRRVSRGKWELDLVPVHSSEKLSQIIHVN